MGNRTGLWVLVVGTVSLLVGAFGGPIFGEDLDFPIWIFTWIGLGLIVVGAVIQMMRRSRT